MGWAWALILSELAPDRADAILARGLAYGESRAVCGVHYASDVEAGPAALAVNGNDVGLAWAACVGQSDGNGCGIRFRRYDANLSPAGESVLVNSTTVGDQEDPSIGWLPDRSVAIAYSDTSATDPDRDATAVRARIIYPVAP